MAKFIDLDEGLPALLNKVKAWVNSNLATKQDTLTFDNTPTANSNNVVKSGGVYTALAGKQATLVSGTNIKTVNNTSLLGEGNIAIPAGADGVTPHIDPTTGNWFIGTTNTGVHAQGPQGNTVVVGGEDEFLIVNNLTDGGEGDALSAEMGKWLYTNLYTIFSQLGTYAFPNGKPQIDWGGGNPPVIPPCTVSKTIGTGLSSTGGDSDVAFGDPLEVSIAITNNLYIVDDDSVEVTMGGSPVQGAWNASTMKVTIAAVTGDVVVNVPSMTYESSNLAFHLDCKNRGGQSGHWIDLIGNKDFTLNQVQESDSGMVFDGINSTALHSGSLAVGYTTGTIEFVCAPTNNITILSTILFNGYLGGIIACCNKNAPTSFEGISTAYSNNANADKLSVALSGIPAAASLNIDNGGNRAALIDGVLGTSVIGDYYYSERAVRTGKMTVGCFIDNDTGNPKPIEAITIKAIRVYSSQLTLAQAQHNYKVDKKRFNLS